MADVSKIKLGSTTYNIKDANAARSSHTHNYAGSSSAGGVATSAHMIDGFASNNTSFTWGNQTGTAIKVFNDSSGGSMGWRKDNPASGQMSQVIDGTIYIKEGAVNVGDAIKSITRSGTTFTYTTLWGNTGTFTQQDNNTTYTAATAAPGDISSSAGAQGSSTNYARQDHTHKIVVATGDSNGQVKIAGTNVSVKGLGSAAYTASTAYAAASHTHDDRYYTETEINNMNINKEAYLTWGGKNFAGGYSPIDAAMVDVLGANRLMFAKAAGITVEYSRDGGSTWTDYGLTNSQKVGIFSNGYNVSIGKADSTNKATANTDKYQLRITLDTGAASIYTVLNKFVIYISTNGSANCTCTIQKALQSSPTNYSDVATNVGISGWSGYNVINVSGITTYGNTASSQYGRIRFIFKANGGNTSYNGLAISKILGFGGVGWTVPSTYASTGHLYSFDADQNATFPAKITATSFSGPLTGNVTGNCSGSSGSCTGNSATATKATGDESGNNIKASYAASFSISDHTITLKNKNGASLGTVTVPDNNTTYPIGYKTIDGSYKTAYRTQTKGNTNSGDYISTIRNNTASVDASPRYGSGLAWGREDTHGYLYVDYAGDGFYIGGGNANKLNWTSRVYTTNYKPTLTPTTTSVCGPASVSGTVLTLGVNVNAVTGVSIS